MNDLSEFFKSGLLNLHKTTIEKNYKPKSLKERLDNFNDMRRDTRNTLIFRKRKISKNITPTSTPECSRNIKVTEESGLRPSTRLEKLQKYKAEKEKQKQEEKKKMKPPFKVCHVPDEFGIPDSENLKKKFKGKSVKVIEQSRSQFAPPNHKFQPPKNIKPISAKSKTNETSLIKSNPNIFKTNITTHSHANTISNNSNNYVHTCTRGKEENTFHRITRAVTRNMQCEMNKLNQRPNKTCDKPKVNDFTTASISNQTQKTSFVQKSVSKIDKTKNKQLGNIEKTRCAVRKGALRGPAKYGTTKYMDEKTAIINSELNKSETLLQGNSENSKPLKKSHKSELWSETWNQPKQIKDEFLPIKMRLQKSTYKEIPECERSLTSKNIKTFNKTKEIDWEINSSNIFKKCGVNAAYHDSSIEQNSSKANGSFHTPVKNIQDEPVYVSPFVTVSRGKSSARKEYYGRHSASTEFNTNILCNTSPKAGAAYFSKKLDNEINRIEDICDAWNNYKSSKEIPDEAVDMIDVAVGQSRLLISKKFQQFRNLIEQCKKCEFSEKSITSEDLHGFWDMIYMQVEDLDKRFNNLNILKANNWQEVIPEKKTVVKPRKRQKKAAPSVMLKNIIKAARDTKKTVNEAQDIERNDEFKVFTGGFFSIESPVRDLNKLNIKDTDTREGLHISSLINQALNSRSSNSGLTVMNVSQSIKHGNGVTPGKSILKNDETKPAKKLNKTVLFKENIEEVTEKDVTCTKEGCSDSKENDINEINLNSFSCFTPRRSKRLSKINRNE